MCEGMYEGGEEGVGSGALDSGGVEVVIDGLSDLECGGMVDSVECVLGAAVGLGVGHEGRDRESER